MNHGTVKFFDPNSDKNFGFIAVAGKKDVFFHLKNGKTMEEKNGRPEFSQKNVLREPKKDDAIIFEAVQSEKGPRASHWAFLEDYTRVMEAIASRPRPTDDAKKPAMVDLGQAHEGKSLCPPGKNKIKRGVEETKRKVPYNRAKAKMG